MELLKFSLNGAPREDVSGGSHTENFIVTINDKECLAKVVGLSGKEDQFANLSEAIAMGQEVEKYRALLTLKGIKTPENLGYLVYPLEGRPCIVELVPYMGNSLERKLMGDITWEAWHPWIDGLLADVGKLLDKQNPLKKVAVGIDPKPSNYVITEDGNLCYVDLIWPLRKQNLTNMVHEAIRPIWKFRYFNPVGILLNISVQVSRLHLSFRPHIVETILNFAGSRPELHKQLLKTPGFSRDILQLSDDSIDDIHEDHIDVLRDLGLELLHILKRPEEITFLIEQTRTNPRLTRPKDRLSTVKPSLKGLLKTAQEKLS